MKEWIEKLYELHDLTRMGHAQRVEDANLGLGWLYYALVRVIRPQTVFVIGSYRGFVPLITGKALADNSEQGRVLFIDPSFVDDFWKDPEAVKRYFDGLGVTNITHFPQTTQEFVQTETYRCLDQIGIVFIDGHHSEDQVRFDYESFEGLLAPDGVILLHDSLRVRVSRMYGEDQVYEHQVKCFVDKLAQIPSLQVLELPFGDGVTIVRKVASDEANQRANQ